MMLEDKSGCTWVASVHAVEWLNVQLRWLWNCQWLFFTWALCLANSVVLAWVQSDISIWCSSMCVDLPDKLSCGVQMYLSQCSAYSAGSFAALRLVWMFSSLCCLTLFSVIQLLENNLQAFSMCRLLNSSRVKSGPFPLKNISSC